MAYTRALPTPVFGVSTVAERARAQGYAEKQINMRSDVQDKLVRRPKTKHTFVKLPVPTIGGRVVANEVFFKDGIRHEVVIYAAINGDKLQVFYREDNEGFKQQLITVGTAWLGGVQQDIGVNMLDSDYYIWSRKQKIETELVAPIEPELYKKTALINVISAMNYAERVTVTLTTGETVEEVFWEVPGLTAENQAEADAARATNAVAEGLGIAIFAMTNVTAVWEGSNIVITSTTADDLQVTVSSGRGEGAVEVFNHRIASIDFMPKYCTPGVVRAVVANPRSSKGAYYLKAEPVEEDATGISEVVWVETRSPTEALQFTENSFLVHLDTEEDTLEKFTFNEQLAGDKKSNPPLDFIGHPVEFVELFQDRLAILAGSRISFSRTGDYDQMWKGSATETLVSDPTSVGTSGNSSTLRYAVYHNRDLLIFADNAQFKLAGDQALTPQTAAMPKSTSNECDLTVTPVQMGSNVYYASSYGNSVGVRRFEVQENTTVDQSVSITDHIIGLMKGSIVELVSNANQDLLIVRSSESAPEQFFVFELQLVGEELISSWSEWRLATGMAIDKLDIFNEVLTIRYNERSYVTCNLREDELLPARDVCLDQYAERVGEGTQVVLPTGWELLPGLVPTVLLGDDNIERLVELQVELTEDANRLELGEDVEGKRLLLGYKYESVYQPSKLFRRDRQGNIQTKDRLRLVHFLLELDNTYRLTRSIVSDYWEIPDEVITGLDGFSDIDTPTVSPYSGLWQTSIGMNTTDCQVVFKDDSPYTSNIVGISYTAQLYSTTSRR